jgi:serine/threonine-protein kinase
MAAIDAERDLLFGLLALQNGLINQGQLVAAFQAWTLDKGRTLADHLVGRGDLDADDQLVVDALVARHLKKYDGDAEKSLAAISTGSSTRAKLAGLGDAQIDSSLAHVGAGSGSTQHEGDPDSDRTDSYSVGTATSDGQRFRVLRPHARGGLGAVFVALDTELNREVALKRILDSHADDPSSRARFVIEAEITGGLEHPGIVPVYGLGTYAGGRPFYAMRLIRGNSLKNAIVSFHADPALKRDPGQRMLELRKLLRRFVDVCNAIGYAHSRGVVHRDIKPGNIIVGKHGETLVVDWGLAKPLGRHEAGESSDERTFIPTSASGSAETLPGSALGTPAYMSPEQAAGALDRLGPRSDVYSLGATLYVLLTGEPPFAGEDVGSVLAAVQKAEFPSPRRLEPSVEKALEAICLKAMAAQPEERYNSPRVLADDIERWMADEPVTAWRQPLGERTRRWMRRHRPAVAGGAALLVTAVVALLIGTILLRAANERVREQRDVARRQRELAQEGFRQARQAVDEYFTRVSESTLLDSPVPGMQPLRKELLETALRYYRGFQAQSRDDRALRAELARANYRVGRINEMIGTNDETLAAYEEARTLGERLVLDHPADAAMRHDLARANRAAGRILIHRMGEPAEGLARLRTAVSLSESLVREQPGDPEFEAELANSYVDLGAALRTRKESLGELPSLEKALAIWNRLARALPGYRLQQAQTLSGIGDCYSQAGNAAAALAHLERAREILERLRTEKPGGINLAWELAELWHRTGWVHRGLTHRAVEAQNAFRQSGEIWDRLAKENPAVGTYRWRAAAANFWIGDTLAESGSSALAVRVLDGAIKEGEQIFAADPSDFARGEALVEAEVSLGKALANLGRLTEALVPLSKARAMLDTIRRADPDKTYTLVHQARCIRFQGGVLQSLGRDAEAQRALAEAVRLLEETSEEARRRNNFIISNLAVICGDLGKLQFTSGRLPEAEATLEKADALGLAYTGKDRTPRLDPFWLAAARIDLGLVRMALGKHEQARESLFRARETLRAQSKPHPASLPWLAAAGSALAELAASVAEREEFDREATDAFRRAVAVAEPRALGEIATDPGLRGLRMRTDTGTLLYDRIFPADPFAPRPGAFAREPGSDR